MSRHGHLPRSDEQLPKTSSAEELEDIENEGSLIHPIPVSLQDLSRPPEQTTKTKIHGAMSSTISCQSLPPKPNLFALRLKGNFLGYEIQNDGTGLHQLLVFVCVLLTKLASNAADELVTQLQFLKAAWQDHSVQSLVEFLSKSQALKAARQDHSSKVWLKDQPNVRLCRPLGQVTRSKFQLKGSPSVKL